MEPNVSICDQRNAYHKTACVELKNRNGCTHTIITVNLFLHGTLQMYLCDQRGEKTRTEEVNEEDESEETYITFLVRPLASRFQQYSTGVFASRRLWNVPNIIVRNSLVPMQWDVEYTMLPYIYIIYFVKQQQLLSIIYSQHNICKKKIK